MRLCTKKDFNRNKDWQAVWEELEENKSYPMCIDNLKDANLMNTLSSATGSSVNIELKKCRGVGCNPRNTVNSFVGNI